MSDTLQPDVTGYSESRDRVRAHRKRRARGIWRRTLSVEDGQLDRLEERGYLDPDRHGDRNDERDAIEMFLTDSLRKG